MKSIILLFITTIFISLLPGCTNDEVKELNKKEETDSLKNITKLEKFLSKKGELYIKEFYDVGTIKSNTNLSGIMSITAVILYNPGEEEKRIKGLKIEIKKYEYSSYDSYGKIETAFLDMEELKGLVDAITYMNDLIKKWESASKEYTEVIYSTTGNFQIGFFMKTNSKNTEELWGFAQAGYSKVSCYFHPDVTAQLDSVRDKINKGITLLNSK
jgi:hypothetical protein